MPVGSTTILLDFQADGGWVIPLTIDESGYELIDEIADEYLTLCLRGTVPKIEDYCQAYPWLADEIRQLFPMLKYLEASKQSQAPFQLPDSVGSYRVVREVGRGGMGIVVEAVHRANGQRVALKILLPENHDLVEPSVIDRFEQEANAVSRIDHPHVVPLYEVGKDKNLRFISMQLIEGSSLDRIVRLLACASRSREDQWFESVMHHVTDRQQPMAEEDYFSWVVDIGIRTAEALHHAHQLKILHRDVKPSNILIDRQGLAWLTDFGLAKTDDAKLTRTGQVIGTLRYLAPERLHGQCDHLADVYGLGLTLYELLALQPAFPDDDRVRLIDAVDRADPLPPRKIAPRVPRELENIVMGAISKQKNRRPQTAMEMARQLRSCNRLTNPGQRRSSWKWIGRWFKRTR